MWIKTYIFTYKILHENILDTITAVRLINCLKFCPARKSRTLKTFYITVPWIVILFYIIFLVGIYRYGSRLPLNCFMWSLSLGNKSGLKAQSYPLWLTSPCSRTAIRTCLAIGIIRTCLGVGCRGLVSGWLASLLFLLLVERLLSDLSFFFGVLLTHFLSLVHAHARHRAPVGRE